MNHVRLKGLQLEGVRSFRTKQSFALPERGMVMVRGRSGHGKSNFALGIAHALDYSPLPATDLVAWDWEGKWGAQALLSINDHVVSVERGSKFSLVEDGEDIKGSAASKKERLTRSIGLEPDLLGALTYRPQRKFGLFLSMQDDEKKEFLTKLLDLGKFEREAEAAEKSFPDLTKAAEEAAAVRDRVQTLVDHLRAQGFPLQEESEAASAYEKAFALYNVAVESAAVVELKRREYLEQAQKEENAAYEAALSGVREAEADFAAAQASRPPLPDIEVTPEESRLQALLFKATELLKKLQNDDRVQHNEINRQREQFQTRRSMARVLISQEPKTKQALADAKHRLEHLKSTTTCPTCKQEWTGGLDKEALIAIAHTEYEEAIKNLNAIEVQRRELAHAEDQLLKLLFTPNPKIEQMLTAKSKAEQQLVAERTKAAGAREQMQAKYAAEDANWRMMIATAKANAERERNAVREIYRKGLAEMQAIADPLQTAMHEAHRKALAAREVLTNIQAQNRTQRANQQKRDTDLSVAEADLAATILEHDRKKSAEAKARDFAALTRSYLDKIFDEVLVEIAAETNSVLVRVPNVQHITFGFRSEVEAKTTGKKKAKIAPIVHIDGVQRPFDGLSGGQKSVVELATDIAIRRVVTNRRQVHIGWLLLDEAFDGLGKVEKEACLEVLQLAAQDDLILVVDHATEFRDMFTQFIDIEMVQGESRVQ